MSFSTADVRIFAERRTGTDRRRGTLPNFSKYWLTGRRATARRAEDREKAQALDRHSLKTFLIILLIIMLSVVDAALTLHLVARGAAELNPVMNYYLGHGPVVFFGVKYFLTCASIFIVLLKENARLFGTRVRMKSLFLLFLLPYALVVQWEIYLVMTN